MFKTLIIDNFDSFTYNIFQRMGEVCGEEPTVLLNTEDFDAIDLHRCDCIIVSPGEGTRARAADVGTSACAIWETRAPLLVVCLGHQCMAHLHDIEIVLAPAPIHGRVSLSARRSRRVSRSAAGVVRGAIPLAGGETDSRTIRAERMGRQRHDPRHPPQDLPAARWQLHSESICIEFGTDPFRNFRD